MSATTGIEWTDSTWNPVTGCTEVSPGCDHCYAKTLAERFRGTPGHYYEQGFDVVLRQSKLEQPLRWANPRRIFVNSMSDLFHDAIPDDYIAQVFAVMAQAGHHTFQLLTKRHGRMRALLNSEVFLGLVDSHLGGDGTATSFRGDATWPLPNVWVGVSVENQQWADIRIPALLDTPAVVRFLSMEPLLGAVDLSRYLCCRVCHTVHRFLDRPCDPAMPPRLRAPLHPDRPMIDWVIAGGESGRDARPMHPDWVREIRDRCELVSVPFHFKQWGEWAPGYSHGEGEEGPGDSFVNLDGTTGHVWFNEDLGYPTNYSGRWSETSHTVSRVGKKAAGRELDGRTWDQFPDTQLGAS